MAAAEAVRMKEKQRIDRENNFRRRGTRDTP
jgi:hypothetical protein